LKGQLQTVEVNGLENCQRAVINVISAGASSANKDPTYKLVVEGTNLMGVMGTQGVVGTEVETNHVFDVYRSLGIEAARQTIANEINVVLGNHDLVVDKRHMALLADIMTFKGEVLGITRFGIAKMKESVMTLASFEQTTDHLFEAAIRGSCDKMEGVSECIIIGDHMPVGTGLFALHHAPHVVPEHKDSAVSPGFQVPTSKKKQKQMRRASAAGQHIAPAVVPQRSAFEPFSRSQLLLQDEDAKLDIFN
jgi:DNA-directed RNA polymerase III subunit RPC1